MIDDAATVRDIADAVAEKFGIRAGEEFSLRKVTPPGLSKSPLWLDESRTLHENDVAPDEPLEFAKRFFFSDDRVDKDDPFTLHLLYDEAQKAIITGRYPCSRDNAKEFAALQMQVLYKDFNPGRAATVDRVNFLPKQYRKDDKLIPEILSAYKSLFGMKDMDAKFRYITSVRSLKTYGITFFACRQKVPGSKKDLKISIGITRSKVIKLETETQKELKSWPFEHLRRWSGEAGVFTLDFGDYADDYLTLYTDEAEGMSQLIAGYIDIILRQRVDTERVVEDDDSLMAEEQLLQGNFGVGQLGATAGFSSPYPGGQSVPQMLHPGQQNSGQIYDPNSADTAETVGLPGPYQTGTMHNLPPSHKVNVVDMGSAIKCCRLLSEELGAKKLNFGGLSLPPEEWQKKFNGHQDGLKNNLQDMLAQALMSPSGLKRNDLDNKAKDLATDLKGMSMAAGALTDLNPDNFPLMDATKSYSDTIGDILNELMKGVDGPNTFSLGDILEAAKKVWGGACMLGANSQLCNYADKGSNLLMLECVEDINVNMDGLLKEVEGVLPKLPAPKQRELLTEVGKVGGIKNLALGNLANLCNQVLDPEILNQVSVTCGILETAKQNLVKKLNAAGIPISQQPSMAEYDAAIDTALMNLQDAARTAEARGIDGNLDIVVPAEELLSSLANLRNDLQSPPKLLEGVSQVTRLQNKLAAVTKLLAFGCPSGLAAQLTDYSTQIAYSCQELMEGARILLKTPGDLQQVGKSRAVIGQMEGQVQALIGDAASVAALNNLRFSAKVTTASLMKLATNSNTASANCTNPQIRADLLASAKGVQESLAGLLAALQGASSDPTNYVKQSDLLEITRSQIPYYSQLVSTAKCVATRSLTDLNKKQKLNHASQETADNLRQLMKAIKDVSDIGGQTEVEEAMQEFDASRHDLDTADFFAEQGLLKPIPGQTRQDSQALLKRGCDVIAQEMDNLVAAPQQGMLADHIRQVALGLGQIVIAARTAASTMQDPSAQKQMIGTAKELLDDTLNAIGMARACSIDPENPTKRDNLEKGRRKFQGTLGTISDFASAVDLKDLNGAVESIEKQKGLLTKNSPNKMSYKDASDALESSTKAFNSVVHQLTSVAKTNPANLGSAAKLNATTCSQLLGMCSVAATAAPNKSIADGILAAGRALADAMQGLLNSAKNVATNKTPNSLLDLSNNQDLVQQAAEQLVLSCASSTNPDVDLALKKIKDAVGHLEIGAISAGAGTKENLLLQFLQACKDMARVTSNLVASASVSTNTHGQLSKEAAGLVTSLLSTTQGLSNQTGDDQQTSGQLVSTTKQVALATHDMIRASAAIANNSGAEGVHSDLANATSTVAQSIQNLSKVCGALNPGVKECQRAINELTKASTLLEQATKSAMMGTLSKEPGSGKPYQQLQSDSGLIASKALKDLNALVEASNGTFSDLQKAAAAVSMTVPQLAMSIRATAIACPDQPTQTKILTATKQLVDSFNRILNEVQNVGDQDSAQRLNKLDTSAQDLIGTLLGELQSSAQIVQDLDALMASLKASISEVAQPLSGQPASYSQYREQLSEGTNDLVSALAAITATDKKNLGQLSIVARRVGDAVPPLIAAIRGCIGTTKDQEARKGLLDCTKLLGQAVLVTVNTTKGIVEGQDGAQLERGCQAANKACADLLVTAKKGAIADAQIEAALETIKKWIAQISTAAVFAQAGQLEEQKSAAAMTMNDLQAKVQAAAQNLQQTSTQLVGSTRAGTPDETLGTNCVAVSQAVEVASKFSWALAAKMQDSNGQQNILSASKTVAITAQQLVLAAKDAHKFPNDPQAKATLAAAEKAVNDQINALNSVIRTVAAEALRCQNELDNAITAIKKLKDTAPGYPVSTPVDVIYGCKEVLAAASELIFAQNQIDTMEAGKANVSAADVLINAAYTVAKSAPDAFIGQTLTTNIGKAADELCKLLETAKLSRQDPTTQTKLELQGEKVTQSINGIVASLRRFPGAAGISLTDKDKDLDSQAQQELMKCHQIIEDAIRSIQTPKPSQLQPQEDYDRANATVVEAAKSIGTTTMNLIQASLIAQQDKAKKQKLSEGDKYAPDPMFINGLISSAQNVAVCVQEVASSTNKSTNTAPDEASLIASATAVGQATSGLSAKFKDTANVQNCAKAVAAATNGMVKAAKNYSAVAEGIDAKKRLNTVGSSHAGSETDQWVRIIRLERELEQEKKKAAAMQAVKLKANNRKTILIQQGGK